MTGEFLPLRFVTGEFMVATGLFGAALSPIPIGWKLGWREGAQGRSLPLPCLTAWGLANMISGLLLLATVALIILPIGPPIIETSHVILRVGGVSTLIAFIPVIATVFITYFFAARHHAREVISGLAKSQPGTRHPAEEALPGPEG